MDHLGDVAALTARIKVGRIIDNGPLQITVRNLEQSYAAYAKVRDNYAHLAAKELSAPDDFIANLEEKCEGKWIKLSALADGSFTVTNRRSVFSKTYKQR